MVHKMKIMVHEMKLLEPHFNKIKNGRKTIEVRLYDDKRAEVSIDDKIIFQRYDNPNQKISTVVYGLSRFKTFEQLYTSLNKRI